MVMTDPIADMLTRVRNASSARHEAVDIPASRIKESIAAILREEGFIQSYERINEGPQGVLRVHLKYGPDRKRVLMGIRRISRPGLRVYARKDQMPRVLGGIGVAVVSTSKGIVTDAEARRLGLGGEVLCYIW
ncbi:MAG: 30S ribosomal protein S8 [Thermaerobacter sp.]|nr:30S ribosomal protein S8 [Thermaerobacter sp.]